MVELLKEDRQSLTLKLEDLASLQDAGLDGAALVVRPLNKEHLETLILSDPKDWPPIIVTKTDIGHVIIDGYHRREAARAKGLASLKATSRTYKSDAEVVEATFRANLTHGLKASAENRSSYAYWLHLTYPDMEQKEIAQRCGITQPAVSIAITRREEQARKEAARAEGEPVEVNVDEAYSPVFRTFKLFERTTAKLFKSLGHIDDQELVTRIRATIDTDEDREHLEHLGRLLLESAKKARRPKATKVVEAEAVAQS
jgi:predicted transcriptional regulator